MNVIQLTAPRTALLACGLALAALLHGAEPAPDQQVNRERTGDNANPRAKDDAYNGTTTGNRRITIDAEHGVLANDPDINADVIVAEVVKAPPRAAHFALNGDGSFTYEPQPGFVGLDTFTYRAQEGGRASPPATVTIRMPHIPVTIKEKTDADGNVIQPKELTEKEPDGAGFVVYPVNGPVNFDLVVRCLVSGQAPSANGQPPSVPMGYASQGLDFELPAKDSIVIPANSTGKSIELTVLPDKLVEGTEIVDIQLVQDGGSANFTFLESSSSLRIADNDYWKWDDQSASGKYMAKEFDPKIGDVTALVGSGWYRDGKTGARVWDDGDSKFQPSATYRVWKDRVVVKVAARWERYHGRGSFAERDVHNPNYGLDYTFEFHPIQGNINIKSGSGGGRGQPSVNGGHVGISYRYAIDNTATYKKTATMSYHVIAAVGGTLADGSFPFGPHTGGSSVRYTETRDGGGTALSERAVVTFTLRSTEDP